MGQGGVIPPSCQSNEFAEEISRVLLPGGTFMQLMWSTTQAGEYLDRVEAEYQDASKRYGKIFKNRLTVLDVPDNYITKVLKITK